MSEHLIRSIGKRIKQLRKQKGRKLTELAQAANVSKGLLSKIENGHTVPSLPVLLEVIKVLKIQPEVFFAGLDFENTPPYIHQSSENVVPIEKSEDAKGVIHHFILEKSMDHLHLEANILELKPKAQRKKRPVATYAFKYVLEGEVSYQLKNEQILLKKGDGLLYNEMLPMTAQNNGDKNAKLLVVYLHQEKQMEDKK